MCFGIDHFCRFSNALLPVQRHESFLLHITQVFLRLSGKQASVFLQSSPMFLTARQAKIVDRGSKMCHHIITKSVHCDNRSHAFQTPILCPKMWLKRWEEAAVCPKRELVIEVSEECQTCRKETPVQPWEDATGPVGYVTSGMSSPARESLPDFDWSSFERSDSDSMEKGMEEEFAVQSYINTRPDSPTKKDLARTEWPL